MDADSRAQRRRFILAQHPDRGGDARAFDEGLRRFDAPAQFAPPSPPATRTPGDDVPGPRASMDAAYATDQGADDGQDWPVGLWTLVLGRRRARRR